MADTHHEGGHPAEHGHAAEHAHPGAKEYLAIATVLVVITAIEVAVFYVPQLKGILVPTLLLLSAVKFGLVAAFYMHLKFDHRMFTWLFVLPMLLATFVILALIYLFGHGS